MVDRYDRGDRSFVFRVPLHTEKTTFVFTAEAAAAALTRHRRQADRPLLVGLKVLVEQLLERSQHSLVNTVARDELAVVKADAVVE